MFTKRVFLRLLNQLLIVYFCREPVLAICTVRFGGILSAAAWTNWISRTTMPPLSQNLFTTEGRTPPPLDLNMAVPAVLMYSSNILSQFFPGENLVKVAESRNMNKHCCEHSPENKVDGNANCNIY